MNRHDVGVLVSRALAVWTAGRALMELLRLPQFGLGPSLQTTSWTIAAYVSSLLVWIVIAALLWLKAGSFGTWVGPEPDSAETMPVDKTSVGTGLLQAVGIYWIAHSVWKAVFIRQELPVSWPDMDAAITEQYWHLGSLVALGVFGLCLVAYARTITGRLER